MHKLNDVDIFQSCTLAPLWCKTLPTGNELALSQHNNLQLADLTAFVVQPSSKHFQPAI